jgi:hypothetical protein
MPARTASDEQLGAVLPATWTDPHLNVARGAAAAALAFHHAARGGGAGPGVPAPGRGAGGGADALAPPGAEIAEVVELPVADLARPEVRAEEVRDFPTWPAPRRIRLWRVGRHEVWGVTYRILEPLVPRLLGGEWPL